MVAAVLSVFFVSEFTSDMVSIGVALTSCIPYNIVHVYIYSCNRSITMPTMVDNAYRISEGTL